MTHPVARSRSAVVHVVLAALAWIPLVATAPGSVAADTRQHLYLDPGGFLERARSIWDPLVHMGTVTHQNLGLISPMGVWFWVVDVVGIPVWLGQRLWIGAIVFAAAAGVLHLGRTLGWELTGSTASALLYAFSPYLLQYATRTSVLLLPFAGLPWLLSFTVRAVRSGRWRDPAACGLVVFLVGSVNATSLVLVGLAPVLWVLYVMLSREATARRALAATGRIGVACAAVSAWWVVGLVVQARHGLPVLTYTETLDQVAVTSAATEALRGLGYWVFYGREVLDPNVGAAVAYTQNPALLTITYAIPLIALAAAVTVRFRERGYFALLAVVGTIVAVGAFPPEDPSFGGEVFRDAANTTAGLALRSSTRAVPLVALALAVFVGRGVDALRVRPPVRWRVVAGVGGVAVAALPALVTGGFVDPNFARPAALPEQWEEVAAHLDDQDDDGAVLEIPGIQFTTYRWGTTYEPVTPGLVDRPVIAREQLPYGSPPSADLLIALDRRFQEGITEPAAIAPIARLMGAEWILLRNDLAFERYVSPRPRRLWNELLPLPDGLRSVAGFGEPTRNTPDPRLPLLDEEAFGLDDDAPDPSPVELLAVEEPRDRLRSAPASGAQVVVGDGEGVVDTAAAGLLAADGAVFYGATLLADPNLYEDVLDDTASVVVTDTARKRERRWRSVRWSTGYTERADEDRPETDVGDGDLDVFDDLGPDAQTTVVQQGATVDATVYGGPFTLDPDGRPALAVDGRPDTAWVVGPFTDARGAAITIRPDDPQGGPLTIAQEPGANRITEIDVSVDGGEARRVALDDRSLDDGGQPVELAGQVERSLRIEIVATEHDAGAGPPVAITEISLGDLTVDERVQMPTSFVDLLDRSSPTPPVTYVMTRLRSDPSEPVRDDEEPVLRRRFRTAGPSTVSVGGTARLSGDAPQTLLADVLGASGPRITTSTVLPGDLTSRGAAAFDDDPETAWQPAFLDLDGAWIEVETDELVTLDRVGITVVDDGEHSVPTQFSVSVDGRTQVVDVPADDLRGQTPDGDRRDLELPLEPVRGSTIRLTATRTDQRLTTDYYTRGPIATPLGIAEIDLPGVATVDPSTRIDSGCRDDLLAIDGTPVALRLSGDTDDALAGRPVEIEGCSDVDLGDGDHELDATPGERTGFDLDRIVLLPDDPATTGTGDTEPAPPITDVETVSPTRHEATLGPGDEAIVVLAQSNESGWRLTVDGADLGESFLVDAGFNGWRVPASPDARDIVVEWTPQRAVDKALLASAAAVLVVVLLLVFGRRDRSSPAVDAPSFATLRPRSRPSTAHAVATISAGALLGLVTLDLLGSFVGAAAAVIALRAPGGRLVVAAGTVVAWSAAAAWVVAMQVLDPRRADFEWAARLDGPHQLALLSIVFLAVVVLADGGLRREGS